MLYKRCVDIIVFLGKRRKPVPVSEVAKALSVSPRTIRSDIDIIDAWLKTNGFETIIKVTGLGVMLRDDDKSIHYCLRGLYEHNYHLSHEERACVIISLVLLETNIITTKDIATQFNVSAATISGDIKVVKTWMSDNKLNLISRPHIGIYIKDSEQNIRRGCYILFREIIATHLNYGDIIASGFLELEHMLKRQSINLFYEVLKKYRMSILKIIHHYKKSSGAELSDEGICDFFCHILITVTRMLQGRQITLEHEYANQCSEYFIDITDYFIQEFAIPLSKDDCTYINLTWLSVMKYGEFAYVTDIDLKTSSELIRKVKEKSGLGLGFDVEYVSMVELALHINSYKGRATLNLPSFSDETLNHFYAQYRAIFAETYELLVDFLQHTIKITTKYTEIEVTNLFLHIISFIYKEAEHCYGQPKKVLIICGNMIATSKILESRLKSLFFNIDIVGIVSYNEFLANEKTYDCDIVLSTLPLNIKRYNCVQVSPLLLPDDIEKLTLLFSTKTSTLDQSNYKSAMINVVSRSLSLSPQQKGMIMLEMAKSFDAELGKVSVQEYMQLKDVLNHSLVEVNIPAVNWEDGIRITGELLRKQNKINHRHIEEMVRLNKYLKGYCVVDKGVALPHLLADDVSGPHMSITTLKKPIVFGNSRNDPVKIVIMLVTNNNYTHVNILEELIEILNNPEHKDALMNSKTKDDLLQQLNFNNII